MLTVVMLNNLMPSVVMLSVTTLSKEKSLIERNRNGNKVRAFKLIIWRELS